MDFAFLIERKKRKMETTSGVGNKEIKIDELNKKKSFIKRKSNLSEN